jgi:hypothetical protein
MKNFSFLFLLLCITGNVFGQINCDTLHSGTFVYFDANDEEVYITIKDDIHTEYYAYGKYTVQASLEWTDDCSYVATLEESTVPNFPAKKGDKMVTRFIRTEENKVVYESTVLDRTWEGAIYKIEKLPEIVKQ